MSTQAEAKAAVHQFLDKWHAAAAVGDADFYFGSMTPTSHWLGTDATENWDKDSFVAFAKPYFDAKKAWDFKAVERNVYVAGSGEVAWFDEVLDTWMKGCRGSGVVEWEAATGRWMVQHYVLSMTIPNGSGKEELNEHVLPFKGKYENKLLEEMRARVKRN